MSVFDRKVAVILLRNHFTNIRACSGLESRDFMVTAHDGTFRIAGYRNNDPRKVMRGELLSKRLNLDALRESSLGREILTISKRMQEHGFIR